MGLEGYSDPILGAIQVPDLSFSWSLMSVGWWAKVLREDLSSVQPFLCSTIAPTHGCAHRVWDSHCAYVQSSFLSWCDFLFCMLGSLVSCACEVKHYQATFPA